MATITRPITRSIISTTQWGIPITDQVNQNTTDVATINTKITPSTWTAPTLQNGWTATAGGFAPPNYRKIGDIAYLRGEMNSGSFSVAAFTLPAGYRPPLFLEFGTAVYSSATLGYIAIGLRVNTDGTVVVYYTGAASTLSVPLNQIFFSTI